MRFFINLIDSPKRLVDIALGLSISSFFWWILLMDCLVLLAAIGFSILIGFFRGEETWQFQEIGLITIASAIQLLMISYTAKHIFELRGGKGRVEKLTQLPWSDPTMIWIIISFGFLFLVFDEVLFIHQVIDKGIHLVLNIQETAITDRLDEVIVGLYGLAGVFVLLFFRKELLSIKSSIPFLIAGFFCLFLMVGLDIATNRKDIIEMYILSPERVDEVYRLLSIGEEFTKLVGESMFLVGFSHCAKKLRDERKENDPTDGPAPYFV